MNGLEKGKQNCYAPIHIYASQKGATAGVVLWQHLEHLLYNNIPFSSRKIWISFSDFLNRRIINRGIHVESIYSNKRKDIFVVQLGEICTGFEPRAPYVPPTDCAQKSLLPVTVIQQIRWISQYPRNNVSHYFLRSVTTNALVLLKTIHDLILAEFCSSLDY